MAKMLTTKKVAQLLNVSEATVKRLTDGGFLEAEKTMGGHRRFRVEKVVRFQQEQQHGGKASSVRSINTSENKSHNNGKSEVSFEPLFESLINGDIAETSSIILNAHLGGANLSYIFDELICKAMRHVGDLWYQGDLTIAQEHLATRTVIMAINTLSNTLINGNKRLPFSAVCCCVEEDFHDLPLYLTQTLLENEGWKVINLGANTPFFSLAEAVTQHKPNLVCISATVFYSVDRAAREYKDVQLASAKNESSIVVGGKGFEDKKIRARFPATLYADNFAQLFDFANSLRTV